ncbi:TPA: hypothetical protein ACH3X3_013792 [Trebouxia sp. C0006]
MGGEPVYLNIYDLSDQNSWTYWCGVGIFHSGLEVYGVEYAYGGHEYDVSGVFATNPKDAPGPGESPLLNELQLQAGASCTPAWLNVLHFAVLFRENVLVGHTQMSPQRVQQAVQEMGEQYKGNAYHLLQRNCNHFSNDLCVKLTGQPAPLWINRLAGMAVMLHCLIPTAWVPPLSPPTASPVLGPEPVHVDVHQEERQGLLSPSDRQRLHSKDAWPAQQQQLQREALHT